MSSDVHEVTLDVLLEFVKHTRGFDFTGYKRSTIERRVAKRMGEPRFVKRFAQAGRPGAYLRVIETGDVGAGDAVEVVSRPDHGVDVLMVSRAMLGDRSLLPRLLDAPQLPEKGRVWARARLAPQRG